MNAEHECAQDVTLSLYVESEHDLHEITLGCVECWTSDDAVYFLQKIELQRDADSPKGLPRLTCPDFD